VIDCIYGYIIFILFMICGAMYCVGVGGVYNSLCIWRGVIVIVMVVCIELLL